jgi:lipoprotein-releasing system ATP-binding protein
MNKILEAIDLHKVYRTGPVDLKVLKGVNLALGEGEFLAVVGTSGAGKSTLLHILGLLDSPTYGEVRYRQSPLQNLPRAEQNKMRNKIFGFVFQFYHLLPEFNALENLLMPLAVGRSTRKWLKERGELKDKGMKLLERVGLGERANHRPGRLSGGECQRLAIARALMNEPEILLCDEPTGNLDAKTGGSIMKLLLEINSRGQSIVMVTHNMDLAEAAQRTVRLREGRIHPL